MSGTRAFGGYTPRVAKALHRHLRHYTEIAPHGSWNWCWFGKAAEAVGELHEARAAYQVALDLELHGDQETDAADRLARMLPG